MKVHRMSRPRRMEDDGRGAGEGWGVNRSPLKRPRTDPKADLREKLRKGSDRTDPSQVKFVHPSSTPLELETDPAVLARRQKEIDYGKVNVAYMIYREHVEKDQRDASMPRTPDKYQKYGRRRWDGMVKAWKKSIHSIAEKIQESKVKVEGEAGDELFGKERIGSWADSVEEEEQMEAEFRSRASSCTSSDQGISCSGSGSVTPSPFSRSISPAAEFGKTAEVDRTAEIGQGGGSSAIKQEQEEELLDFIET